MAHNGDSDEEQAGPSGSEEPVTFTQAGSGYAPAAFQMGGLGSALPSPPGGHLQHMHRAQQPHQYPHAIQYALPPSQSEPQYHARAFEPYGHGPPPRPFHSDTFDPASYGRLQQQLLQQQQQQQQQAGGFSQQRPPQYPFGYAGGPQQPMPQQHWGVASQPSQMPTTHWTVPNGMQMRMPQQVALPLPPLPGQPMVPPMPPQMSVLPPLPPQSSWPGGPGLEAAGQGYGLAPPAGGPQQWQGQGGPHSPHSPHRGGGQGGWDLRQAGQMMPQLPNDLPLPLPGTSWQAPQLSLAEIGRWERPTSPLQAPPPSAAEIGRSEIGRWERPTSPLPARPGYGSRGRPSVVLTNFTDLAVGELEVYKHDVTFSPEMKTSQVRRRILTELAPQIQQLLPEVPSGWAYDGDKILYSVGRLSSGPIELRRSEEGAEEGGGGGRSGGGGGGGGDSGGGGGGGGAGSGGGGPGRKKREVVVTLKEVGQLNLGGLRLPTGKSYEGATERLRPMMQVAPTPWPRAPRVAASPRHGAGCCGR